MGEIGFRLIGDGARDQRLPRAGGSVKENAFRRIDPQSFKDLGILQRKLYHLPDSLYLGTEPADILV